MPSKSIFRQPGAQHFQVVHRSQRDPLINDPDASQHVLKPVIRENAKKGKSRADLESQLTPSVLTPESERPNIGEATLYGVYFDDTEYDYMQHLKQQDEGFESILVEAPKRRTVSKTTTTGSLAVSLRDLPPEVFPSTSELPRDFEGQAAVQSSIFGLQPDMDPHLRQTLEALEDDAYVDDDVGDDFFGGLIEDGERDANEPFNYDFVEDESLPSGSGDTNAHESNGEDETGWEAKFAAFQKEKQGRKAMDPSFSDGGSETGDTVGQMPEFSAHGRRRRRRETSDASGFTMSSLSISRSEGLRDLDDRFDKLEKEYMEDEDSEDDPLDSDSSDSTPELITSREDFEALMDDFLRNYEVSGGKMKPSLPGSGSEKLQSLRLAMGRDERVMVDNLDQQERDDGDINSMIEEQGKRERWDVETVLTTYTNLENHPRLIKAFEARKGPRIRLDPKTGLPLVESDPALTPERNVPQSSPPKKTPNPSVTTRRPRGESVEEKKERKHAIKAARQARRVEKKDNKDQFSAAVKQRSQELAKTVAIVRKL